MSRRKTEGLRAELQDSQFGASFVYDYIADIAPDSGAPVFRATFTVHFTGRHRNRPDAGQQAPVRFDQHSGKVELDHAALDAELREAKQAARDVFDATATADPLDRLERLAALHDRGVLTDAEFASQKAKILGESS